VSSSFRTNFTACGKTQRFVIPTRLSPRNPSFVWQAHNHGEIPRPKAPRNGRRKYFFRILPLRAESSDLSLRGIRDCRTKRTARNAALHDHSHTRRGRPSSCWRDSLPADRSRPARKAGIEQAGLLQAKKNRIRAQQRAELVARHSGTRHENRDFFVIPPEARSLYAVGSRNFHVR